VIALCSPDGIVGTGLPMCPSEKRLSRTRSRGECKAFSSPVQLKHLQNCGDFSQFSGKSGEVSLRSRLRGGARGIRTLGTGSEATRVVRDAKFRNKFLEMPRRVSTGNCDDFRRKQIHDRSILIRRPNGAIETKKTGTSAFFAS
jgi:hypothetical protein